MPKSYAASPGHSNVSGGRCALKTSAQYSTSRRARPPETLEWPGEAAERSAIDHRATRLRERRETKLHSTGQRSAVPRRRRPAVILFPDAHPWEIGAAPDVAEGEPMRRRECDEECVFAGAAHQVSGISTRRGVVRQAAEIRSASGDSWGMRPVELGSSAEVVGRAKRRLIRLRFSRARFEDRHALLEKRRSQRDVLRPADWPIDTGKIRHALADPNSSSMQLDSPFEGDPSDRKVGSQCHRVS